MDKKIVWKQTKRDLFKLCKFIFILFCDMFAGAVETSAKQKSVGEANARFTRSGYNPAYRPGSLRNPIKK